MNFWKQSVTKMLDHYKSGDFTEEDVQIENQDEMGQLVRNFNRMKHAMEEHIHTLQEKNEMSTRLHREEVERMETEKRLEAARMELLKSQINPHFLFNTLSMIACTAQLEDAEITEKMITSMSSLFRYNLKTSEQIVALKQELDVVEHYIYIQKMRFGSRVSYRTIIQVDPGQIASAGFYHAAADRKCHCPWDFQKRIGRNSVCPDLGKGKSGNYFSGRQWAGYEQGTAL